KQDHIIRMREFMQAIKDGDTTPEELFPSLKTEKEKEKIRKDKDVSARTVKENDSSNEEK
ncbi:MAG: hypothetical protein ACQESM_10430, partial [Bacteroidota bacterium]